MAQRSIQAINTGPCRCCPACAFCRSPTGVGGVVPEVLGPGGVTAHPVYASLSGYNTTAFAGFPSVYDDLLARVPSPPWNAIDGSYLLENFTATPPVIRGGFRSVTPGRAGGLSLFISQYSSAEFRPDAALLSILKAIYDAETAGCGYGGTFPSPGGDQFNLPALEAWVGTYLAVTLGCPAYPYGADAAYLPVSVELIVSVSIRVRTDGLDPGNTDARYADVAKSISKKSLKYVRLGDIDCVNRVFQIVTNTSSGLADRVTLVKLRNFASCVDTNYPTYAPYPGTLTVTWT